LKDRDFRKMRSIVFSDDTPRRDARGGILLPSAAGRQPLVHHSTDRSPSRTNGPPESGKFAGAAERITWGLPALAFA